MRIISVPTQKFRLQNPIFHAFYAEMGRQGVEADDFRLRDLFARDLAIFQVHFPEHFAMNYGPAAALMRSGTLILAMLICKLRRVPIVWTVHNIAPFENRNTLLYRLLMWAFVRLVDGHIFLSRSSEQQFAQHFPHVRPKACALISHPSYPVEPAPPPPHDDVVIGMIGEQKTYKQPLQSLRLFRTAHDLVDCRLLIAGKVHDPDPFREALTDFPEEHVQWLDRRLDDQELERAAREVDFVLLPYSMITNSGAAIYALSCERPIVASPLPLFLELRELFGPAWVRIADGSEKHPSFWTKPTAEDRDRLKRKLKEINLSATAARHIGFFKRLRAA